MVILETKEWAEVTFGPCQLGDKRRNQRLIKLAQQVAARPDGSTPEQTESWGDCKAAYRLFNQEPVSSQAENETRREEYSPTFGGSRIGGLGQSH